MLKCIYFFKQMYRVGCDQVVVHCLWKILSNVFHFLCPFSFSDDKKLIQKQMAFMLARQQIYLELDENMDDYDDLVEIMSNAHLNNNFLSLAREVRTYISCPLITTGSLVA